MEKVHKNDTSNNKPSSKCFSIYINDNSFFYVRKMSIFIHRFFHIVTNTWPI